MVDTIWVAAQQQLRSSLSDKDFDTWIAPLRAIGWQDGELTIEVPSAFVRDWLREHHKSLIERALGEVSGGGGALRFVVNRTLQSPALPRRREPLPARREREVASTSREAPPRPARYTFDTFVVGDSNRVAYEAARSVVADPGGPFNPLFVFGGVGLGKTHLLSAVANGLASRSPGERVTYVSAENFVNEMIAALQKDAMERFRARFRKIGTLIVDDVQFLADKRRSQEEFFHTFNALHDGRKQIVLASDRAPQELPGIQDTLRSRFAAGLLADVKSPDPELRDALVRRKAGELGLTLREELVTELARRWCENVRELEGVLLRLSALTKVGGGEATPALLRQAVLPYRRPASGQEQVGRIVDLVCRHYRVTRDEITSERRTARVTLPRQVAMYLAREHTEEPLGAIGAEFGGRDHSTVVHALGRIERRLREDTELRAAVTVLRAQLTG
jgi:chromosomal replication initiator protein